MKEIPRMEKTEIQVTQEDIKNLIDNAEHDFNAKVQAYVEYQTRNTSGKDINVMNKLNKDILQAREYYNKLIEVSGLPEEEKKMRLFRE